MQTARRKGYKLIYTPDAKIWHKEALLVAISKLFQFAIGEQKAVLFFFRNLKFRYFFIRNVTLFIKLLLKIMFFKGEEKMCNCKIPWINGWNKMVFHQKRIMDIILM